MTEEQYRKFSEYFKANPRRAFLLRATVKIMTGFVFLAFCGILLYLLMKREFRVAYETVLVCGVGFFACSILRYFIGAKRPYELYDIAPTLNRSKNGDSFPSRHVFSITMITIAAARVCPVLAVVLGIMTVILAALRIIGGVHFTRDVLFGAFLAVFWSLIGYWICYLI